MNILKYLAAPAVITLVLSASSCKKTADSPADANTGNAAATEQETSNITVQPMHIETPTIVNCKLIDSPTLDEKTRTYSFSVSADLLNMPEARIVYILTVKGDASKTEIARNDTGRFSGIEGLDDGGVYVVTAYATEDVCEYVEVSNCCKVMVQEKLSMDEIQKMVDELKEDSSNVSLMDINDQIVPDIVLHFSNIKQGETVPLGFAGIQEKFIFGDWSDIRVTGVAYDNFGRVNELTFTIKY